MTTHPARLASAFDPPLSPETAARLLADPRFADRIDALLGGAHDAPARETLDALAPRAGAVLFARSFLREIRGPVIADLTARFGPEALTDARTHADLAWDRPAPEDAGALAEAVEIAGAACLGAWIDSLPDTERRGVTRQWPDDASLPRTDDDRILTLGPQIMNRLIETQ